MSADAVLRCPLDFHLPSLRGGVLDAPPFTRAGDAKFGHIANGGTFVRIRTLPITF